MNEFEEVIQKKDKRIANSYQKISILKIELDECKKIIMKQKGYIDTLKQKIADLEA